MAEIIPKSDDLTKDSAIVMSEDKIGIFRGLWATIAKELPSRYFFGLLETEGMSLNQIAEDVEVSWKTVKKRVEDLKACGFIGKEELYDNDRFREKEQYKYYLDAELVSGMTSPYSLEVILSTISIPTCVVLWLVGFSILFPSFLFLFIWFVVSILMKQRWKGF